MHIPGYFGQGARLSTTPHCDWTQIIKKRTRLGDRSSGQKIVGQHTSMVKGDLKEDQGGSTVAPATIRDRVMDSHAITSKPTPTETYTVSTHLRRVQPALPTGTQGEVMAKHGTGVSNFCLQ